MYIDIDGYIYSSGSSAHADDRAVRPALHLNSSSSCWSYAGTVCANGTVDEKGENNDSTLDNLTPDTSTTLIPHKNSHNRYAISGSGNVTVLVGDKLQIEGGKKRSYRVQSGKYISVSSKGEIKAKKAGDGGIITYTTTSGETANIAVTAIYPKLEICNNVGISKLNVLIKKGT